MPCRLALLRSNLHTHLHHLSSTCVARHTLNVVAPRTYRFSSKSQSESFTSSRGSRSLKTPANTPLLRRSPSSLSLTPRFAGQRRHYRWARTPTRNDDDSDRASAGRNTTQNNYSIEALSKNRLWTTVAGFDPASSPRNALVWETYLGYARTVYHDANFDLSTTFGAQKVSKKEKAMGDLGKLVLADRDMEDFKGLRETDLMGWKFGRMHAALRNYLRSLGEGEGPPTTSRVVEARREEEKRAAKDTRDRVTRGILEGKRVPRGRPRGQRSILGEGIKRMWVWPQTRAREESLREHKVDHSEVA